MTLPLTDEQLAALDSLAEQAYLSRAPVGSLTREVMDDPVGDGNLGFYCADESYIVGLLNSYPGLRERLRLAEERLEIAEGYIRSEVWDYYDDAWRAAVDRVKLSPLRGK